MYEVSDSGVKEEAGKRNGRRNAGSSQRSPPTSRVTKGAKSRQHKGLICQKSTVHAKAFPFLRFNTLGIWNFLMKHEHLRFINEEEIIHSNGADSCFARADRQARRSAKSLTIVRSSQIFNTCVWRIFFVRIQHRCPEQTRWFSSRWCRSPARCWPSG